MAVFKCKMCGGQLDIQEEQTVIECEYCGTKQTVPVLDDEKKVSLFSRANKLRAACDFDKAFSVYESIVAEYENEAEGYWGLILCKYGIEYVDDPASSKKVPTCHRTSFDSVLDDPNFDLVMENADGIARKVYRDEAKQIESLRTKIIELSSKEEPYDIFICYKETAEDGDRTIDSVIAQDVYTQLTDKGYKVFFSRITLEDKLGQEYEPYIFSALNSAKVMLVFGTDYEYFNAVWVKNEWSRYLKLMEKDNKKVLIPCYKEIDAYDMPKEFKHLQAQDMGKVGATQDLLRGIEKIIPLKRQESNKEENLSSNPRVNSLLKRAFNFLEDEEWERAYDYSEKVLDIDPDNAQAYLVQLLYNFEISHVEDLVDCDEEFDDYGIYEKIMCYGDSKLKKQLKSIAKTIRERNERNEREKQLDNAMKLYPEAVEKMNLAKTDKDYLEAAQLFDSILFYKDSKDLMNECLQKENEIKSIKKNMIVALMNEYKSLYESNKYDENIQEIKSKLIQYEIGKQFVNSVEYLNAKVGDTIFFGEYEQSNSGKEKIEWIVLDKKNNKTLLISKKAIECIKYNKNSKGTNNGSWKYSWENSDIRKWLNGDFFNKAFSNDEKELILECENENNYSEVEDVFSEYVLDYVFCLNKKEVLKYLKSDSDRKCDPTQLAKNHGAKPPMFNTSCSWWLRAPVEKRIGLSDNTVVYGVTLVGYKGNISKIGLPIDGIGTGVRPCLWVGVDMDSLDNQ